jgi:hypothetical protein
MEQRPLRLGDILDDYCPRERRVTNHAVVAMIEDAVRLTRCTTCDAEHDYKGGKAPRRRVKKESPAALYKEVLAGMPEAPVAPVAPALAAPVPALAVEPPVAALVTGHVIDALDAVAEEAQRVAASPAPVEPEPEAALEEGPVHRPLIRATLPRPEGQKDARALPDFTMRQPIGRGRFRPDGRMRPRGAGHQGGQGNGHRGQGGGRFGGPRPGGRRNRGR